MIRRYLAVPGALLLTAACIRAAMTSAWDVPTITLIAAGALVLSAAALLNRGELAAWIHDPRGVFAVSTGISVVVAVAALAMLNIAVWYNPHSLDLTASGRNEVTQETRQMLARLDTPVTLRQFGRTSDPALEKLLRGFSRETPQVRVEFVDVDRERRLTAEYGVTRVGSVVVAAGGRFRKIETLNEASLATAILQVTSTVARVICFATGHGERGIADTSAAGLSGVAAMLESGGYTSRTISLLEGEVPHECAALVVPGALEEIGSVERRTLDAYFMRQGRVALMLEPEPAASFRDWLAARGIEPGHGAVVDTSGGGRQLGGGPRAPLALEYPDHPITRGFGILVLFDGARPLTVLDRAALGGHPAPLARTGARSFATRAADAVPAFDRSRDAAGPLTIAAAISVRSGRREDEQSRLAVFGDVDVFANAHLRLPANRDFFLRTLGWLLGDAEATLVAVNDRENRRILLTEQTKAWMYVVNLAILPLIPLVAGLVVFVRSRR